MSWPRFEPDEIEAAAAVLRSGRVNYWTGEHGRRFEQEMARGCGVRHAVAVANGTVALELALWASGIDDGEVVVPSRTFVATASAVLMRGATPVFADVEPASGGVTAETIAACLSPRTRAVIVVHLGGWPCAMEPIVELCRARGLRLIEDCAQAQGAAIGERPVGSFGDAATFSFCQDKITTTAGEGGMLVTDDDALWERAWSHKDHGKDWGEVHRDDHPPGFRWLHRRLGTNWRLSEIQAAVGRRQLGKLPRWLEHRRAMARRLTDRLHGVPGLHVPRPGPSLRPAWYRLYAHVEPTALAPGWSRDRIMAELLARGVGAGSGSCSEVYREAAFPPALRPSQPRPVARRLAETSLAFRVDPTVSAEEIDRSGTVVTEVMESAT